jgi:outer membrane murein-binding lipoprotein Lpp
MHVGLVAILAYLVALGGLTTLEYLVLLDPLTQAIVAVQSVLYAAGVVGYLRNTRTVAAESQQLAAVRARLEALIPTLQQRQAHQPFTPHEAQELIEALLPDADDASSPLQHALRWALAAVRTSGGTRAPMPAGRDHTDLRPLPPLLLTLGLLGTFLGLVRAMATLRTAATDIVGVLAMLLGGVDQALGTSIVGLVGSALLGGLYAHGARRQQQVQTAIEHFVTCDLLPVLWCSSPEEEGLRGLQRLPEALGWALRDAVQEAVDRVLAGSGTLLAAATDRLEQVHDRLAVLAGESMETLTTLTTAARDELQAVHQQHAALVEHFGQADRGLTQALGELSTGVRTLQVQQDVLTQNMRTATAAARAAQETGETLRGVLTQQEQVLQDATATTRETARQLAAARDTVANGAEHVEQLLDGHLHTLRQVATEHMQGVEATHTRIDTTLGRLDRHAEALAQAMTILAQWGNAQRVAEVLGTLEQLGHTLTLLHRQQMARRNGFGGLLSRLRGGHA